MLSERHRRKRMQLYEQGPGPETDACVLQESLRPGLKTGNPEAWRGRPRRGFIFLCFFIPGSGKQSTQPPLLPPPPPAAPHRPLPTSLPSVGDTLYLFNTQKRGFSSYNHSRDSRALMVSCPFFFFPFLLLASL